MRTAHRTQNRRTTLAVILFAFGLLAMLVGQAGAAPDKGDRPGNNGTIKIDGTPLQGGQRNEPQVDCDFAVEFYGYDEGDLNASLSFELQAPTRRASGSQVLATDRLRIGEDPAGGATDLDASQKYNLEFIGVVPHQQQGYHVKLTVQAEGSQGADVKHKVFWVQPCAASSTTTTTVTTAPPTTVTTTTPTTTATTVAPTTVAPVVQGEVLERPAVTSAPLAVQPQALARTGSGVSRLAGLGAGLLLAGLVVLMARSWRPQPV